MKTIDELQLEVAAQYGEAKALLDTAETEDRDFSDEEKTQHDELVAGIEVKQSRIKRRTHLEDVSRPGRVCPPIPLPMAPRTPDDADEDRADPPGEKRVMVPARAKSVHLRFGDSPELMLSMSHYMRAAAGKFESLRWCENHGIELRIHTEGTNTEGGYAVLEGFNANIIRLVEERGVFRREANIVRMSTDIVNRLRRTSGLDVTYTGEGSAGTDTTMAFDNVVLSVKKAMLVTMITSELSEDAAISIMDALTGEIAYAFANAEDVAGFNGTGASATGGINGVRNSLLGLSATRVNIAGLFVQATGTTWGAVVLADFNSVLGLLPMYAQANAKWYMHQAFWATVAQTLAYAAGGNTTQTIAGGMVDSFLGIPVVKVQVMPAVTSTDTVVALLGDLRQAADFGDRRQLSISVSEHATIGSTNVFESDALAVRATERYDINVHSVGNASATASLRVPGPVVGLLTGV